MSKTGYLRNLIFIFCFLAIAGCATVPEKTPTRIEGVPGFYHRMERGQTLWRISRMYGVDLDDVVNVNRISDVTNVEVGQLIFIPRALQKQPVTPDSTSFDDFMWPLRGRIISGFGQTMNNTVNKGINIRIPAVTNVAASRAGRVVFYSPYFKGYGKTLIIDHGDGFSTVYARNSEVLVKVGDHVAKGMIIAKAGDAKDMNSYFHFEIRKGISSQNPVFYLQ